MKKIFIFLIIAFSYVFADNTNSKSETKFCGIVYQQTKDFNYNFNTIVTNEHNIEQKIKNFNGFSCFNERTKNTSAEVVLSNINFITGEYTCVINSNNSTTTEEDRIKGNIGKDILQEEGEKINFINQACIKDVSKNLIVPMLKENNNKYEISIQPKIIINNKNEKENYFGTFLAGKGKNQSTLIEDRYRLSKIGNILNEKISSLRNEIGQQINNQFDQLPILDKYSDNTTISEFLTGIITVDTDYIQNNISNTIVDSEGRLLIKDDIKDINFDEIDNKSLLDRVKGLFSSDDELAYIPIVSLTNNIIDPYFWGWYAIFIENLKTAEYYLVLFLFFCGFSFLSAQHFLTYLKEKMKDNNKNTFSFSKIGILPFTMLITFTAPIIPSNLEIDKKFIYQSSNLNTNIDLNTDTNSEKVQYFNSTIIQSGIRYMAKWGVMAANEVSKYALYTYNRYLAVASYKQFHRGLSLFNDDPLQDTIKSFDLLYKQVSFYSYFCKPIYGRDPNIFEDSILLPIPLSSNKTYSFRDINEAYYADNSLNNNSKSTEKKEKGIREKFKSNLGFSRPTAELCANLEIQIQNNSKDTMSKYSVYEDNFGKNNFSEKDIAKALHNATLLNVKLFTLQNNVGWIMAPLIPSTYSITKLLNINDYIKKQQKNAQIYVTNSATSENRASVTPYKETTYDKISNFIKGLGMTDFLSKVMYYLFFFILPGFADIYKALEELFTVFSLSAISFLTAVSAYFTGGVGAIAVAFILFLAKSILQPIASFLCATFIYTNIIKLFVSIVALLLGLYKIAWYYIELMLFFVSSPVVAIWSVINKKDNVVYTYLGNALRLSLTPILITISVYIFIFSTELITNLFSILFAAFQDLYNSSEIDISTSIFVAVFGVITDLCLQFMYIVLAWIIIGKFTQWFWKSVGVNVSHMEEHSNDLFEKSKGMYGVKI